MAIWRQACYEISSAHASATDAAHASHGAAVARWQQACEM